MRIRILTPLALLVLGGILVNCGGRSSIPASPVPNIAGAWEFIAVSSNGPVTGIEVALKEGQVLVNGFEQPDGQITASGLQITFVSLAQASQVFNATGFGGSCLPVTASSSVGPGSVTALGSPINFTFFNVTGMLGGDGQSMLNGTYAAVNGNACTTDTGGTITGAVVPKLSGTFAGQMCPLGSSSCEPKTGLTDTVVSATLSENSSGTATLSLVLTGTDNTTFTMSGPVTGNAFSLQGTFQGQLLTYYGYYEVKSNAPALYLVNATSPAQPVYVGTLGLPPI